MYTRERAILDHESEIASFEQLKLDGVKEVSQFPMGKPEPIDDVIDFWKKRLKEIYDLPHDASFEKFNY
jgi:cephalosporin-C deacetylase-like acetyl esterase